MCFDTLDLIKKSLPFIENYLWHNWMMKKIVIKLHQCQKAKQVLCLQYCS